MKKCCIRTFISLLIIVVLIAVAVIVLLNLTPAQLKLADKQIAGTSLAENGLGDVKLIKIAQGIRALSKKESAVVKNGFAPEQEKPRLDEFFEGSSYADATQYAGIGESTVEFNRRYMRVMADTTLAYIVNDVIGEEYKLGTDNSTSALRVREVTITKSINDDKAVGNMHVVVGVHTSTFLGSVVDMVKKVKVIKLPEYVYVTIDATFDVGTDGAEKGKVLIKETTAYAGGDENNALNTLLFKRLAGAMDLSGDGQEAVGKFVVDKVTAVLSHLGVIGQASATTTLGEVTGTVDTENLQGVENHKLYLVVYKE